LWLASPALPIGAYAYSRGLEYAVSEGWVVDAESARDWIAGVLERQLASLDVPVLARLYDGFATGDDEAVQYWNAFASATRESAELALEDRQLGRGLARVLSEAGIAAAEGWRETGGYATLFALACVDGGVSRSEAVTTYLFAFCEGQVTAASKLIPLGQRAAQRVLGDLLVQLDGLAQQALALEDHELGAYTPGVALGSALHETQYSRLFRS
jgi:urease accessory protein